LLEDVGSLRAEVVHMKRRRQLRTSDQRDRLRRYIRKVRANYNRASRELFEASRIRRGCPLELALRCKRFDDANEILKLAEKCLAELNHCYVLRLAALRPGDHIVVKIVLPGFDPSPRRYIVLDALWSKGDQYHYEVQELTKSGKVHGRRYSHGLWPSDRVSIEYCDQQLAPDAQALADGRRRGSKDLIVAVLEEGDLSLFLPEPPATAGPVPKAYPFWRRG
jgi:hypothetical protein